MDFDWDVGNLSHIRKRRITPREVEEALTDANQAGAIAYSPAGERREAIIGMTRSGRLLHVVYTERGGRVRPLHVRDAYRDEEREYFGR